MNKTELNKDAYINKMAENLPVLRAKFGLTQEELGLKIDVSRQTIVAIETKKRKMTWSVFLALITIFRRNEVTSQLLDVFEINTDELTKFIVSKDK